MTVVNVKGSKVSRELWTEMLRFSKALRIPLSFFYFEFIQILSFKRFRELNFLGLYLMIYESLKQCSAMSILWNC